MTLGVFVLTGAAVLVVIALGVLALIGPTGRPTQVGRHTTKHQPRQGRQARPQVVRVVTHATSHQVQALEIDDVRVLQDQARRVTSSLAGP